jgi:hypothetical protein
MTHHTIRHSSHRRGWAGAHAFSVPVVRELPRPVGPDSLGGAVW